MGYFDKTCCLTNTAISEGEECLIIILNEDSLGQNKYFYNLVRNAVKQSNRTSQELSDKEVSVMAKYGDKIGDLLPIRDAIVGTYNLSGSIEEEERLPTDYEDFRAGVQIYHVWAVEFVLNKSISELMQNKVKLVADLYEAMQFLRKSPLDLQVIGQQHKDRKEIVEMINFNNRVNKYLTSKLEEYEDYNN